MPNTYICPYCRHEIVNGRPCPKCGEPFNQSHWYEKAIIPEGRIRSEEDGCYRFPQVPDQAEGQVSSPCTQELSALERVSIGGENEHIDITGAKLDTPLAEFYLHTDDDIEWWIVRRRAEAKVVLNGKREIDNCRLEEGDIVTVAGVPILFTGKKLIVGGVEQQKILLETRDITFASGGKKILDKISFQVQPGEFIGILGPSGCGKSSLIQQIVGLSHADSGSILINGRPCADSADAMRQLTAYMPQTVALHTDLTVEEEFKSFSLLHGTSMRNAEAKLALVGLGSQTKKRIGYLSGGEQRRIGIALELLREPQLLVLDEPTAGLDPASETHVMKYLRRLADQGKSILCATHIMENLDKFDKVLVLSQGCEIFFGTPRELLPYFRRLFPNKKISRPVELYDLLDAGSDIQKKEEAERLAAEFKKTRHPAGPGTEREQMENLLCPTRGASSKSQYRGYLLRQVLEFFSFRHTEHPIRAFWSSVCFIQLLVQPILIALALKFACAHLFYQDQTSRLFDLCFFSCIAVFWLGLNNAIRELVKERVPWRCLERLENISMTGYLGAKLSWTALLALAQTSLFYIILYVIMPPAVRWGSDSDVVVRYDIIIFLVLYGVCLSGAWIGLAFSAIFTKENAAVSMLPNILVPVLFFSGTIIGDVYDEKNGIYNIKAAHVEKWMPCYAPAKFLSDYLEEKIRSEQAASIITFLRDYLNKNIWEMSGIKAGLITALVFFTLLIVFQYIHEKNWKGR